MGQGCCLGLGPNPRLAKDENFVELDTPFCVFGPPPTNFLPIGAPPPPKFGANAAFCRVALYIRSKTLKTRLILIKVRLYLSFGVYIYVSAPSDVC